MLGRIYSVPFFFPPPPPLPLLLWRRIGSASAAESISYVAVFRTSVKKDLHYVSGRWNVLGESIMNYFRGTELFECIPKCAYAALECALYVFFSFFIPHFFFSLFCKDCVVNVRDSCTQWTCQDFEPISLAEGKKSRPECRGSLRSSSGSWTKRRKYI